MNPGKGGSSNKAASVRARLRELARREGIEFQLVLSEFAVERFLYRLGRSRHGENYVLKGATLLRLWTDVRGRATWDVDFLGRGASGVADLLAVVRDVCQIPGPDAIEFQVDSIRGEEIRTADKYAGVRVRLEAHLAEARIPLQVDVGLGDAVVPEPTIEAWPTLLDHEAPHILVYPREAVVAEKLETMVSLGLTNSRMKDFYDVQQLAASTRFDGRTLSQAVRSTFERRGTALPSEEPLVLTRSFLTAPDREVQWKAFLRRGRLPGPPSLEELVESLRRFLLPVLQSVGCGRVNAAHWEPGGPWVDGDGGEAR